MRIGIAQINPTLGDFKQNKEKIIDFVVRARQKRCDLVVFPECALFGYHPFDLLERGSVVDDQEHELRDLIKKLPADLGVIIGLITPNPSKKGRPYYNSAALLVRGKKPQFFHKTLLPTGDVFDEARFIEAGDMKRNFFSWKGRRFLLTICEDIWAWPDAEGRTPYKVNPLTQLPRKKVDLIINLSASPWFPGKIDLRQRVASKTARHFKAPLMYVNLVGGQDEIIFDGRSFLLDRQGKKRAECQAFHEDLNVVELESFEAWSPSYPPEGVEELRQGLILGLRDFAEKTGFKKAHLGLSGGIDSAVVACLAADAFGPSKVRAFAMPGPFSAPESLALAKELAEKVGTGFEVLPIESLYQSAKQLCESQWQIKEMSVVQENIQSRLRGLLLMAYANKESSLLLTTGNKCEYATGYATLYGDMCGGLAPIGDLTKEQVYALARHYNREGTLIPERIITRPPTAELRPNQKDQDTLPSYDVLDRAVIQMIEMGKPAKTSVEKWLVGQMFKTEFKRWQGAPILKASSHAFGRGRRFPIAHRAK